MSTPYEDHLYQRIDRLLEENEEFRHRHELDRATILFLARRLIRVVGQRDKARGIAVTLEQRAAIFEDGG